MSDVAEFIGELDAGVFEEKLARILGDTALAAMANSKEGEVTLKFKIKPMSQSQANVSHTIEFKAPTKNGKKSETNTTATLLYVGAKGKMSLFPENQTQMFDKKGATQTA